MTTNKVIFVDSSVVEKEKMFESKTQHLNLELNLTSSFDKKKKTRKKVGQRVRQTGWIQMSTIRHCRLIPHGLCLHDVVLHITSARALRIRTASALTDFPKTRMSSLRVCKFGEVWTFGFSQRQPESSKGHNILSKDRVQCTGDVVLMVVDGLFPQSDLHIGVTLKTQRRRQTFC